MHQGNSDSESEAPSDVLEARSEFVTSMRASAADDIVRIRHAMPLLLGELTGRMRQRAQSFPVLHFDQSQKIGRIDAKTMGEAADWFFIGDLHGDYFALHTLLRYAQSTRPNCKILFLGDMVDRGDYPFECIFLLLEWGMAHPGRLAWIAGNHDIAVVLQEGERRFASLVSPAEVLDVLNADDTLKGFRFALGRFLLELGQRLPRALLFPDGLLATHGGFPLADLQMQGRQAKDEASFMAWLNSENCLKDFTWTRIHRAPKKTPDRYSTGAQYGFKDFEAFCALSTQWFPVKRMVTGHEHPVEGYALHSTYILNPALTLTGFGFHHMKAMPHAYHHYREALFIGQGRVGELPAVLPVPVDREELQWMYPEEPTVVVSSQSSAGGMQSDDERDSTAKPEI